MRPLVLAALAGAVATAWAQERTPGWLGVGLDASGDAVVAGERSFTGWVRLTSVMPGSPADAAGLRAEDRVVATPGMVFGADGGANLAAFRALLANKAAGETVALTVVRDRIERRAAVDDAPVEDTAKAFADPDAMLATRPPGSKLALTAVKVREVLAVTATLGARPSEPGWERAIAPTPFADARASLPVQPLGQALAEEFGAEADLANQRGRLARLVERGDPFRLALVAGALRDPWRAGGLAKLWTDRPEDDAWLTQALAALGSSAEAGPPVRPVRGDASVAEVADILRAHLDASAKQLARATRALTEAERSRLRAGLPALWHLFIDQVMWPLGQDARRAEAIECVRLAARVEVSALVGALQPWVWLATNPHLPGELRRALAAIAPDETRTFDTPWGPIVIAGTGRHWHRKPAAVLIDLGGDDFYTQPASGEIHIVIDLGGDDAYEASFDHAHGAAMLGVSLLADAAGNDRYLAQRWGLGAAACGVAVLIDQAGDDVYRGGDYTMGAAFQGVGLLIDQAGHDRYEAPRYSQGLGMPGGFGALIDAGDGADRYFCKGRDQTGYGDAGIFDGWGQGVGVGFRGLASGGLGLLRDGGGDDVYEAGNFSQGGGYYFGWGALVDGGGDDLYIGSRYAQGFAAHQAVGTFLDVSGNDRYTTRQGVAQGCSWDETVVWFVDRAGDDTYEGGGFFSQGAAAHNGFCVFADLAGRDRYLYGPGQAQAASNDYHGGTSFALFLDVGGAEDAYTGGADAAANGAVRHRDRHGFQVDAPGDLSDAATRFREWIKR